MANLSQILNNIKKKFNKDKKELLAEYIDTIDPSIRGLVSYCNSNGIETIASCSGVLKEHDGKEESLYGQLNIMDSKTTRKVAAYFIDSGIAGVILISEPFDDKELYGNIIDDAHVDLIFKNVNNENLPVIEKAIRTIVEKRITVDKQKLSYVNDIFKFFSTIKAPMDLRYCFNDINHNSNKDTLEFDTCDVVPVCADVNKLTRMIGETTKLEYINTDMDKLLNTNQIIINSHNRKEELPKLFKATKKLERKIDIIPNSYKEPEKYFEDYYGEDIQEINSFFEDLYDKVTDEDYNTICYEKDNKKEDKNKCDYFPDDLS